MIKKTPLYQTHLKYGGDMVEFAGYYLPIRYEGLGVIAEHHAVRKAAGLFDVSHMGELIISGERAEEALNFLLTNDISGMYDGQIRYSVVANENGGAIDDVLVYRKNSQEFMLVVNASNTEKDINWIKARLPKDVGFKDITDEVALLAIQGPKSKDIMLSLAKEEELPQKFYTFKDNVSIKDINCMVSRTGYTGEFGYEIYCRPDDSEKLYEYLMQAGKKHGLTPAGLGARDTLRLEAGMPLYGHELGEDIPLSEVDLGFAIKLNKEDFIGKSAIENHTPLYKRVGAIVTRGIAREGDKVFSGEEEVGVVTSGTHSPTLGKGIAVLRLKAGFVDQPLEAVVRSRRLKLELTPLPFYKK